jgi:cephalosporin-C deacetylase
MPVLDMPLSELRNYTGSSPCPRDIDVYWDKALSDMKAIDANVIITAADFICDFAACYDLTFTGLGGSRVYAKLLKPLNLTRPARHCSNSTATRPAAATGAIIWPMSRRIYRRGA